MGFGDPTKQIYQYISDENDINDKKCIQYFIMHRLVLCIKLNGFVAHMFYAWTIFYKTEEKIY